MNKTKKVEKFSAKNELFFIKISKKAFTKNEKKNAKNSEKRASLRISEY